MAGVAQEIDLKDFGKFTDDLARRWNGMTFRQPLEECSVLVSADFKRNFDGGHDPDGNPWKAIQGLRARGGNKPLRDRGLLMASTGATGSPTVKQISDFGLIQGTNLEYARIHQEGGTIRPKSARALAIPLTREAYRAGSPRNFSGELDLIWPRGKSFGRLVESRGGRRAKSVMHYLLVPSVTIPARPFAGISKRLADGCERILGNHAERTLGVR